jgi:hypothetical protein
MRLEFIGKTKGKITKVGGFTIKLGQKDTLPAAQMRVMAEAPNSILDKFTPGMREFLFEKAKGSEKTQKQLEGIEVVSDLPTLREPGAKLGALHWEDEQTGSTFIVDRAIDPIRLPDCRASKFKIVPKDGGSVQVFFTLTTGEIDRETAGELLLLNKQDIMFELTAPQVHQRELDEPDDDEAPADTSTPPAAKGRRGGAALTPIDALKKADKATGKAANASTKKKAA